MVTWHQVAVAILAWTVLCIKVIVDSTSLVLDDRQRSVFFYEAFLYYSPLLMICLMTYLWGINIFGFAHSRVSYSKVFDLDQTHLTHWSIWRIATGMTVAVITSMAAYLFLAAHGFIFLASLQPTSLYVAIPFLLSLPLDILYAPSRYYFLNTLFRLTFPFQPISFADFFVADVLTSMAKVLSDMERSSCRIMHGQVASLAFMEGDDVCGSKSVMIPLVLAYPYVCRFFQCLRQYSDTKETSCLLNALKYSTAFPVIVLSACKYHVPLDQWLSFYRPLWLLCGVVNSSYSYYWDIARDWDFSLFSCGPPSHNLFLRNNLHYPQKWAYYWVMVSNLFLRVSWTYKLSSHLRHNLTTVFVVAALEMFRRFQWIFFRVENEWNKMTIKASASKGSMNELMDQRDEGENMSENSRLMAPTKESSL